MNHYTGYELLWLFFIYSFGGWVLETISATLKQRKFANRGLVNGPFCVLYGLTAIAMTVGLQELRGIWLFIFATVYATVAEWVSGHLIEKAFKARWWDYSNIKWNLDGYICLPASLFWGVLGYLAVRWCNGVTLILLHILPKLLMQHKNCGKDCRKSGKASEKSISKGKKNRRGNPGRERRKGICKRVRLL